MDRVRDVLLIPWKGSLASGTLPFDLQHSVSRNPTENTAAKKIIPASNANAVLAPYISRNTPPNTGPSAPPSQRIMLKVPIVVASILVSVLTTSSTRIVVDSVITGPKQSPTNAKLTAISHGEAGTCENRSRALPPSRVTATSGFFLPTVSESQPHDDAPRELVIA